MINLNVISRISDDRSVLVMLINALSQLKSKGLNGVNIIFIGTVYSQFVYQNIINTANLLGVEDKIAFTQKSIPVNQLSSEIRDGYFINFTIGKFIGFSGLEGIRYGIKTIFLNTIETAENEDREDLVHCRTLQEFVDLIMDIYAHPHSTNEAIRLCNKQMLDKLFLDSASSSQLLNMMVPR